VEFTEKKYFESMQKILTDKLGFKKNGNKKYSNLAEKSSKIELCALKVLKLLNFCVFILKV
jgi:hypothetical protein